FRIRDTGIGIPRNHLAAIWDQFSQVQRSHTRTVGGTGLGLSVVRRLAQLLGGEATVESVVNEGSTFMVRIPMRVELTDRELDAVADIGKIPYEASVE